MRALLSSVVLAIAVATGGVASAADKYPTVRIGEILYADVTMVAIAEKYFEEELKKVGAEMTFFRTTSGGFMNAAMLGGEVDIAVIGAAPGANAVAQGIPIKIVYVIDYSTTGEGLVARKAIKDVKGLIGKKIATPFVSSSHFGLLNTLNKFGIGLDQVQILDMAAPDMLAAWQQGNIDAAFIWEPHKGRMAGTGGRVLYTSGDIAKATDLKRAAWDISYARTEFVEKYPELVEAYVRAVDRAAKRYQSKPLDAAESVRNLMGVETAKDMKRMMDGFVNATAKQQLERKWFPALAETLHAMGNFFKEMGQLDKAPTKEEVEKVMYTKAVEAVAKE